MKAKPALFLILGVLFLIPSFQVDAIAMEQPGAGMKRLSLLGKSPDWSKLNRFQRTMTREVFEERMNRIYAPGADWQQWFAVSDQGVAAVLCAQDRARRYFIEFASEEPGGQPTGHQTAPLKIVIDPGHIGGAFARMEQRWFQIGDDIPVAEGDLVLVVAKRLRDRLTALGFEVHLTRETAEPVTSMRPDDLLEEAAAVLQQRSPSLQPGSKEWEFSRRSWQNLLFYRVSEIHARAEKINSTLKPDAVLALHINATAWPDPEEQTLVEDTHFHLLLSGAFLPEELEMDDMRFHLLRKLFSRDWERELPLAQAMIESFQKHTGLPPFTYGGPNAVNLAGNPYLWGRNLLANRLFECPVLFLEPHVANSRPAYTRIQQFLRVQQGAIPPPDDCIIEEYVNAVVYGFANANGESMPDQSYD